MFYNLLAVLPLVAGVLGTPLNVEPRATTYTNFTIWAYGSDDIGGFPLIAKDNLAYISTTTPTANSSYESVTFDNYETRGNFTATFEDGTSALLYVPTDGGQVGFTTSTDNSSQITTGFGFYGHVIYIYLDSSFETEWSVLPTDEDNIWQLLWDSSSSNASSVALRNVAPS